MKKSAFQSLLTLQWPGVEEPPCQELEELLWWAVWPRGRNRLCDSWSKRGWLLAHVAVLTPEALSLTRWIPKFKLFPASGTLIKVGPDNSDHEPVCVSFWPRSCMCVVRIENPHVCYSDEEPVGAFGSRHLPQVHSVCCWCVPVFILPLLGGFVYFPNSLSP